MHKPPLPQRPSTDGHPTGLPPPPPAPPGTRPDFPFKWVYANKGLIPEGSIPLGKESDGALSYAARAYHRKSIQIGRVTPALQGVRVGFAGDFAVLKDYYVLCGDPKLTRWVETSGTLNLNQVSFKPIECGLDIKGDPLYLAAIDYKNGRFLGKVGAHTPGMLYTRNGKERAVPLNETYLVLAYS
ncbi:hypothetical protein K7432_006373 [Basidiobolus ranarum]|uniref:Uncharacterized protein n=1 Tax=Basidiobolus ranarum TaxID=34480 RepID=A0ABR2WV33_9FUNG